MSSQNDPFQDLTSFTDKPTEILARLADHLRKARQPHELFETLKLMTRQRLGLPLIAAEGQLNRAEDVERQLESGLLDACREVGEMLLEEQRLQEGWMYLRPVGNLPEVAKLFEAIEATEDNIDDLIQILLHEGVDPPRGFRLLLEHHGTCNSITTFEQTIVQRPRTEQRDVAAILVEHVYDELCEAVRGHIERQEGTCPESTSLAEMISERSWLFADGSYHIDTTHLASTIRFARIMADRSRLEKVAELTQYGRRLNRQYHYPWRGTLCRLLRKP